MDHIVTDNLKNCKDQSNESINSDLKFDTGALKLSSGTIDPLPVVTISLRGGNKHLATTVYLLTCFWNSGATNSMI